MRKSVDFNYGWVFTKQAKAVPDSFPADWVWVNLPHTWNNIDGQDGGNDYYRGTCYYAKKFSKDNLPEADRYFLQINAANSSADVFVNGRKLAHHDGGYSAWRVDITDALKDENLIVISVDNSPCDNVYPQVADFTFYGGLYRGVEIICVHKSHFALDYFGGQAIAVTAELEHEKAQIEIETWVTDMTDKQRVLYSVYDSEGNEVYAKETSDRKISFTIDKPHLWHGKKDPYLYKAQARLIDEGKIIDCVATRFGCRSFRIDPDKGFILNGEPYPLRGVSRHQDRWGVGNALEKEHHIQDMELICEVGATTLRLAHYQHDQFFYDLCDEKGIVVWAEIPYISQHLPKGTQNTVSQMKELVIQNYNHPSIVVWGLSNEITMRGDDDPSLIENHRILNDLCHELDRTRLTTLAAVSPCPDDSEYLKIPDVVAYNHYFGWYGGDVSMNGPWFDEFHSKHPHIPIGCSEYGCEALDWHSSDPVQGDYTQEYQSYYHEELIKQLFSREYLWSTYVWNMFDFGADARQEGGENGQNHKGLVTFDRKYKKDSFYAYKAWLSDEPFVHICSKRYVDRVEKVTRITVYSNQPEVELFLNGKSFEKKKADDHFFRFDIPNEGETEIEAVAGECKDKSFIRKVDVFNEKYRLREKSAILNWFDITEKEGYFSLKDKLSDIMATKEGMEFFKRAFSDMLPEKMNNAAGFEMNDTMLQMMGGFTVIRLAGMLGMMGINLTKEQLLGMNAQLNKIRKS